ARRRGGSGQLVVFQMTAFSSFHGVRGAAENALDALSVISPVEFKWLAGYRVLTASPASGSRAVTIARSATASRRASRARAENRSLSADVCASRTCLVIASRKSPVSSRVRMAFQSDSSILSLYAASRLSI